jgi:D-alanyl-D-alanine dipeptidase
MDEVELAQIINDVALKVTFYTHSNCGQTQRYPVSTMATLLTKAAGMKTMSDHLIALAESYDLNCSEVFKPQD